MIFHILFHELDKKQYGKAVKHIELYRSSYPMLSLPSLVLPPTSLAALLHSLSSENHSLPPVSLVLPLLSCLSCPASLVLPLWSCLSGPASLVRSLLSCLTPHIFFLLATHSPSSFLYSTSMYTCLVFPHICLFIPPTYLIISSYLLVPCPSSYLPFISSYLPCNSLLHIIHFFPPTCLLFYPIRLVFPPTYLVFHLTYLVFPPSYLVCHPDFFAPTVPTCLSSYLPCLTS